MIRVFLAFAFALLATAANAEKAVVAGGCFWCVESDFESVPGVSKVVSGYAGGSSSDPTYKNHEGHYEVVEITFDPARISYEELLHLYFRSIDPTDAGGQFCDRGNSYRTAIFYRNDAQKAAAEAAKAEAGKALDTRIATKIVAAGQFWRAEDYHQDYYKGTNIVLTRAGPKKQSNAYKFYRSACGRDARVKQLWGDQAPFAGH
ncbi:MAG: peptide-methionine (S)-S-oxide reductase MsrA [Paracoccaceae bacterium]